MSQHRKTHRRNRMIAARLASGLLIPFASSGAFAQDAVETEDTDKVVDEIVVVGSQIKGAQITEALPVTVMSADQIEALGVDSGDELLDMIPENGQNYFSEAENISGGVNSARGDIGAFNLRNIGTGNTLVLLNGRRLVNAASYQTELVGGSFVPVNTVNSNTMPVSGIERLEILRDGASAIYGADAVAGVVNTVLQKDYEGLSIRGKWTEFDNVPRNDQSLTIKWGNNFNEGKTNLGVFFNYYQRDRVNSQDDPRWADSDFRYRIPAGSLWEGDTSFRNDSANSIYGQYDMLSGSIPGITDSRGEFETYPAGDPRCQWDLGYGTCGAVDGQGTYRYNLNENRDLVSELDRADLFVYLNHDMDNGMEAFTELSFYQSHTNLYRHPTAPFSTVKLRVAADNYWNPLGPCGSVNRLPDSVIGTDVPCTGVALEIDNYRFTEYPRTVDNDGDVIRFLQGFRGTMQDWDWESAVSYSKATKDDITHNRVSNTLMAEALFDTTEAAYNPFSGGVNSNIERALIDVYRKSETKLTTFDIKVSNNDIYRLPAGPVGVLAGLEWREESFNDDRDPRLDGTIQFTDYQGDTYPFVSDVVNSSPTPDSSGRRTVTSLFGELQIPVTDTLNMQVALRHEEFSDVGNTTVGKLAAGWRVFEPVLFRASVSEAFRAPNLVTINEEIVARVNTRTDWACIYAAENGGDPDQLTLDCENSTTRLAQGSENLKPEESLNWTAGVVVEPIENLTITLDYWSIKKDNTIGLLGEENHTLLDLVYRLEHGNADCSTLAANDAVVRDAAGVDESAIYNAAGICPAGDIAYIDDRYANLDTRTTAGWDFGIFYDWVTKYGDFNLRYVGTFLDKFEQKAGGDSALLVEAQESGLLPANYPVAGFADLVGRDGNQKDRMTASIAWNLGQWGASLSGFRIGDFYQNSLTLADGTRYTIPAMTTYNGTVDYTFDWADVSTRVRLGVNNLTDERAPLADGYFGYFSDAHRDMGRYVYLDVRANF